MNMLEQNVINAALAWHRSPMDRKMFRTRMLSEAIENLEKFRKGPGSYANRLKHKKNGALQRFVDKNEKVLKRLAK